MKWLLVILCFITVACGSSQVTPRSALTPYTFTPYAIYPTHTPIPLPSCSSVSVFIPCFDETPEPGATPVPTPTPYPTFTPLPTSTPLPMIKENELFDRPVLMLTDEELTALMGVLEQQLIQQQVQEAAKW